MIVHLNELGSFEVWPDIRKHARNLYSQYGEDGLLEETFRRIGTTNKWCVDAGCSDGIEFSNTRQFLENGWKGLLIDSNPAAVKRARATACEGTIVEQVPIRASGEDSLDGILTRHPAIPREFDLLNIDIDGADWYVWNSLLCYRPRVVVIEFRAMLEGRYTVPTLADVQKRGYEAQPSYETMLHLGAGKYYTAVWVTYVNIGFVDQMALAGLNHDTKQGAAGEPESQRPAVYGDDQH